MALLNKMILSYPHSTQLETSRLFLFPLSCDQLIKYFQTDFSLENELALTQYPRMLPAELVEAFEQTILPAVTDSTKNYLFSTLWPIVLKDRNILIGDLCFKGEPNKRGEIEIGYGTYPEFQRQGYMTEALTAMIDWAMAQEKVQSILAETEKNNLPSIKTLEKAHFKSFLHVANRMWWRLDRSKPVYK